MSRGWTIEEGRLLPRADAMAGEGSSRCAEGEVLLTGFAHAGRYAHGRLAEEVLEQAEHAAMPFVEHDGDGAAGIVVLPAGAHPASRAKRFAFVLTRERLVLVDGCGVCEPMLEQLVEDAAPVSSAAGALCALLRLPLHDHPATLSRVRDDYEQLEERILAGRERIDRARMMADTRRLLGLDVYYQGLLDMATVLADDACGFVPEEDRGRFSGLARQLERLSARLESLQDYSLQVHGLYQESIDVRQNNVMQWLTVVATIAMPLTFITSWYGMNFTDIPLISVPWGYPVAAALCLVVALAEVWVFHRRGWLSFDGSRRGRHRGSDRDR